jgi:hypothetical protein
VNRKWLNLVDEHLDKDVGLSEKIFFQIIRDNSGWYLRNKRKISAAII